MSEPQPGVMHPVDKAFYDLVVKERNYERVKSARLAEEVERLRGEVEKWRLASRMMDAEVERLREALNAMRLLAKGNSASPTAIAQIMNRVASDMSALPEER